MKICTHCKVEKPLSEFYRMSTKNRFGEQHIHAECKTCFKRRCVDSRDKDKHRQGVIDSRKRDPERAKLWNRVSRAKRRAAMRLAVPKWANKDKIKEIYRLAISSGLHVDHIVPIQSAFVCGLHWEGNLQLLTQKDNLKKTNRAWPDMPLPSEV